jgi:hypothetical protein
VAKKSDGYEELAPATACLLDGDFVLAHLHNYNYLSSTSPNLCLLSLLIQFSVCRRGVVRACFPALRGQAQNKTSELHFNQGEWEGLWDGVDQKVLQGWKAAGL